MTKTPSRKTFHTKTVKSFLSSSYDKKPKGPKGYELDKSLSGRRAQVYKGKDDHAVVVHRGTSGFQDMLTDAKFSLGMKKSNRFKHAAKVQKQAETKYGAQNVTTMGHSLGGALAETVGKNSHKVITLNKAAGPQDVGKRIPSNQVDIRTSKDPVSVLSKEQKGGQRVTINSSTNNPLKEHKTEVLDRINTRV